MSAAGARIIAGPVDAGAFPGLEYPPLLRVRPDPSRRRAQVPPSLEEVEFRETVDLKDPALAAFLAWLIPGLGHLYQGRRGKAGLFFVCIMGTFLYGLYLGSDSDPNDGKDLGWGRVVYVSWRDGDKRLKYLCQVGVGLPALPAVVQSIRTGKGRQAWWNGFMAPPPLVGERRPDGTEVDQFGRPTLNTLKKELDYFEFGEVYTMIAGLLNILAIYDACCGPVFSEKSKKDEDQKQEDDGPREPPSSL